MAKGYSLDLRQRVWTAWQNGEGSRRERARRFAVSLSFVRDLSRRFRQSGSVTAKPHGGGQPLKADARTIRRLQALVAKPNDLTGDEYRRRLMATGSPLSRSSAGRLLLRLDLTRKKRRSKMTQPAVHG